MAVSNIPNMWHCSCDSMRHSWLTKFGVSRLNQFVRAWKVDPVPDVYVFFVSKSLLQHYRGPGQRLKRTLLIERANMDVTCHYRLNLSWVLCYFVLGGLGFSQLNQNTRLITWLMSTDWLHGPNVKALFYSITSTRLKLTNFHCLHVSSVVYDRNTGLFLFGFVGFLICYRTQWRGRSSRTADTSLRFLF